MIVMVSFLLHVVGVVQENCGDCEGTGAAFEVGRTAGPVTVEPAAVGAADIAPETGAGLRGAWDCDGKKRSTNARTATPPLCIVN